MELSALNRLIVDHLRYYGYQIAARIVETEVKANRTRVVDGPSRLFGKIVGCMVDTSSNTIRHVS